MPEALCVNAAKDFDLDGRLSAKQWIRSSMTVFETDWRGEKRFPHLATTVRSLWTEHYIYFGFHCPFASLTFFPQIPSKRILNLYERDVVEVFLGDSERRSCYKEFEVSPNGHWLDLEIDWERGGAQWNWNSGNLAATHVDEREKVWTAELKVPVGCLLRKPSAGQVWPVNFYRVDGREEPRTYLAWSPTQTAQPNYHVPERFGSLHFVNAAAAGADSP